MRAQASAARVVREWLARDDPAALEDLWERADRVRAETVGTQVHLRGLVEISSHCVRACRYCGLGAFNRDLSRYRLAPEEILELAIRAEGLGMGTVVLQAGEDPFFTREIVTETIARVKGATGLAVTLSLGERSVEDLEAWRAAGADRYLLRFETSDAEIFRRIHPARPGAPGRMELLGVLRDLGYEVGSGVMVGLPGQTIESLARDLEIFAELDLDMIGIGPYIPHPATPMGKAIVGRGHDAGRSLLMTMKMVALARLACPEANIPATTAVATSGPEASTTCLRRGANVVMPNMTPTRVRSSYDVYPGKGGCEAAEEGGLDSLAVLLREIGRTVGTGPGPRVGRPCSDGCFLSEGRRVQ